MVPVGMSAQAGTIECQTFAEAEASLGRFIEDVYDTKRLRSATGRPPSSRRRSPSQPSALGCGPGPQSRVQFTLIHKQTIAQLLNSR
jgi:hypothetical protein